ncbi:hypothetical protein [Nocardia sp. NBC_01388]|uniref:hypothetical protein n=1 Tax=Nocardia sp. NBC_01388 TaxID=2903596 RepID=UPI00324C81FC
MKLVRVCADENEASNGLRNDKYTVAMARTSDPHSASAQFDGDPGLGAVAGGCEIERPEICRGTDERTRLG